MSLSSLQVLADNRDALLLAEVAGWLHDIGKCADEHIINQSSDKPNGYKYAYKTAYSNLLDPSLVVNALGENVSLCDLVEQGLPRNVGDTSKPWLVRALGRCHAAAHIEKEEADTSGKQPKHDTRPSTAFGDEGSALCDLTVVLKGLPLNPLAQRNDLLARLQDAFGQALGETRRPENEVTLWDWSSVVASLFKAAVAGGLLGHQPLPADLRWQLLSVRVNRFEFSESVTRISDLQARQAILDNAFERTRVLLEEAFPLATRIYAGVNGHLYIAPNVPSLLDTVSGSGKTLRQLIQEEFAKGTIRDVPRLSIAGEIIPLVEIDRQAWWGQSADRDPKKDEVPPIARILDSQFLTFPNPAKVADWWQQPAQELCSICRLRPMREKAEACEHCIKRRGSRIEWWHEHLQQTIWMDEIADHNDRVALIVGKFGLDDWLSGEMVQTLLARAEENDPGKCTPKNPSPARLRRVWETCQQFWTETVEPILQTHQYAQNAVLSRTRMIVIPDKKDGWKKGYPYDGTINGGVVSLLWLDETKYFVTISNLQLAAGEAKIVDELVQTWQGRDIVVYDPANPRQKIPFKVQGMMQAMASLSQYVPCLTLLTSPDQFLALVPASDALDLTSQIHDEYQKQFGKVQNRLPLFLGLVFFQRKTPLMAVMDTARRMVEQVELSEETWRIRDEVANGQVQFENGITWTVPTKMGDETTEDVWYPYFFFEGDPGTRSRRFQLHGRWLVHVNDLHASDALRVTPSRFAYIYLEHTAQRFRFDPNCDVMLLDELPRLVEMWKRLKDSEITDTSLRGVAQLLYSKTRLWGKNTSEFRYLTETALKKASLWQQEDKPDAVTPDDVIGGRFERCLDLHLSILKERIKKQEVSHEK